MKKLVSAILALTSFGPALAADMAVSHNPPAAGTYKCFHGSAGLSDLIFGAPGSYTGPSGTKGAYTFDAASGELTFTSGHLEGFFGIHWANGDVGLASRQGAGWNTKCNKK